MNLEQRIYQVFDPGEPVDPDQEGLYVDLDAVRGGDHTAARIEKGVRYPKRSGQQLLAGHKGCGKSTELLRLKKRLMSADPANRFFTVFCEGRKDLDLYDVDLPDVVIAIARQVVNQLKEEPLRINLNPGRFRSLFEGLGRILGSLIEFEKFKLDVALVQLSGAIKGSPDLRRELRTAIDRQAPTWIDAVNELLDQANLTLRERGYAGLVVIVDDLDKMVSRELASGVSAEAYLFVNRAAQLAQLRCLAVYSIPLTLAYSYHEKQVAAAFNCKDVPVLPMTKVLGRDGQPYIKGVEQFREVVRARLKHPDLNAQFDEVFESDAILDQLIQLSGGQPSELMTLIREAVVTEGLPITATAVRRVKMEGQREYARQLFKEHWPIIEHVRQLGELPRERSNDNDIRELLASRAVLLYRNDEDWYALNPMVADLKPPAFVNADNQSHDAS